MFFTWGHPEDPHMFECLHTFRCSHAFGCLQYPLCSNTPVCPQCFPVHLHVSGGYMHVIGGCRGPPSVWTVPMCLDAYPCVQHLPHIYMLPCMSVFSRGYCMHYGGTSHMLGAGGGFSTSVRLLVSVRTSIG